MLPLHLYIHFFIYIYTHKAHINILISVLTSIARDCMPHILLYSLSLNTHHMHINLLKANSEGEGERERGNFGPEMDKIQ